MMPTTPVSSSGRFDIIGFSRSTRIPFGSIVRVADRPESLLMRLLIDSLILLMLVAIAIGVVAYRHTSDRQARDRQTVRDSLVMLREQITFHGAIEESTQDGALYPLQVHPWWFTDGQPKNPLVSQDQPWLDIAPPDDYADQPPDPLVTGPGQAAFWYNPNLGVIRARIPWQVSERLTLKLYNRTNNTSLKKLPYDPNPDRLPLAYKPNPVTTGQYATPIQQTSGQVHTLTPQKTNEASATALEKEALPWWDQSNVSRPDTEQQAPQTIDSHNRPSLLSP